MSNYLSLLSGRKKNHCWYSSILREFLMAFRELLIKINQNWINKSGIFKKIRDCAQNQISGTRYNGLCIYWARTGVRVVVLLQRFDDMVRCSPETTAHSILKPACFISQFSVTEHFLRGYFCSTEIQYYGYLSDCTYNTYK